MQEVALVRLRTLGALDLTAEGRSAGLRRLLRKPKRVALMVYLRMHAQLGPVRRDTLLGVFWPDLPQDRGRRALSQALYVLRKELGDGLLETDGQEAVGIDPTRIWCDATEFEDALAHGKPEDALTLYRGALLEGFFLPDAPEFERWLENERARLQDLASDAARELSDQEESAGNVIGAARWARRRAELTPYDERAAVRVIELLLAAGDRSGARHEFRRYCDRLRADLEIEPPAELEQALFPQPDPPVPDRATTAPPSHPAGTQPFERARETTGTVEPPVRQRAARRWRLAIVVTTVVTASLLLTAVFAKESRWRQGSGDPGRLLVAPIVNQTGDSALGPLARLAGDWLGTEIARTGRLRVVPPVYARQVLAGVEAAGDTSSLAVLLAAAARTEASLVIGGNLFGTADSASLEVFGLDPGTGEFAFVLEPIPVTLAAPRDALERLREATLVAVATRLDERLRDWMARATPPPSYEAYRRYAAALDRFFEGTWRAQEEATDLLIDAWRADTAFTAPLIWALLGMMNTDQGDRADSVAHALEVNASSLADWDHAMLRYVLAWLHGDLSARYRWANEVVAMAPNSELRILQAKAMADVGCRDEALAILNGMDARSGFLDRSEFGYWSLRLDLRQLMGDTAGEVRDARLAQAEVSDELHPGYDYRPLVALVRVAAKTGDNPALAQRLGDLRSLGQGAHAAYLKLLFWGPLDLAPDSPEHQTILDSAWAWYQDRPQADRDKCWYKNARFNLLYHMERWQEAEHALDDVAAGGCLAFPAYSTYQATLAAHLGDVDRARAITDSFPWTDHKGTVQLASQAFWKARVEAIAREPARAVVYLRAANRKGVPYGALFENTARVDFAGVWDYEPLQQMVADRRCGES
jgi:DNA-binding SARP family transcriptional activator